ncbi:glycosyltransferase [Microcystis aeruginosa EAWAG127a]|uniref:Glycosyltransferase n=1 Tax=Microcystis aeruginosa EAWAG127a TaxID=2529855 RepID=A0A5J5LZ71_MICAE|nr:glycosyltransferase [Microcystis aeruginosa]KAB0242721.1 glycosyltransferase [Microcystis aeruginosa EAWAG127a]MDB9418512.1 glycosyltransferase [Microcystis aeruginosa CS-556/03]
MTFPFISVIIPIYNGEDDLPDLLKCLQNQTYPREQVEYLLINNNSSDQTGSILEQAVIKSKWSGFPLVVLSENQIQSSYAARNLGIKTARYDLLVFTDADCRPSYQWLEEIVKPFRDVDIGIVAGEIFALTGNSILEKYAERREILSQKFLLEHPFYPYGQTANLAIRKAAFEKVGLFRPYLSTGGDADICWRILRETQWQLAYAPTAVISHRHRSTIKSFRSQFKRYGRSNRYLHELHGCDLQRNFTSSELIYRLGRWLLKELPKNTLKLLFGKADIVDLLAIPLDLIGFQSRSQGQATARLPEKAKEIEWL